MVEILAGVVSFTLIVLLLSVLVLVAKRVLVPSGESTIRVNDRITFEAALGTRLLDALSANDILLPSACGGAGTCGLCKARVLSGGGSAGPQELAQMSRAEAAHGLRLACQVPVLRPMDVEVDENCFGVEVVQAVVESTRNVSTLIREIVLRLPAGKTLDFRAGGFVQITAPPGRVRFRDFEIETAYRDVWDSLDLWALESSSNAPTTRAYSMANPPAQCDVVTLNVRIALPPPGRKATPPGVVSSWLFALRAADTVELAGPFGDFYVEPGDNEILFIGGGAGMAPLRAQILDLLESGGSKRRMSFWYGGRSRRELFYEETFDRLQTEHDNFSWHVALSEPEDGDNWTGATGFIHTVVAELYLASHPSPESCDYYLCGPPLMVSAVRGMLDEIGVEPQRIHYDDFGS